MLESDPKIHHCIICNCFETCSGSDCDFRELESMHGSCMAIVAGHHGIITDEELNAGLIRRGILRA